MTNARSRGRLTVLALTALPVAFAAPTAPAAPLELVLESGIGQVESFAAFGGELYAGVRPTGGPMPAQVLRSADGLGFTSVPVGTPSLVNPRSLQSYGGHLYLLGAAASPAAVATVWRLGPAGFAPTATGGFGDATNIDLPGSAVFDGRLYAGSRNDGGAGGQVWSSADGTSWVQSGAGGLGDPNNARIGELAVFGGMLYAGTRNDSNGANLYRTADGTTWTKVVGAGSATPGGFGDVANRGIFASSVFGGSLFVGLENNEDSSSLAQVWRSSDGIDWTQANADGFGNPDNRAIDAMIVFGGKLYVGTNNSVTGAELWATGDGSSWELVAAAGFGDPLTNTGVRSLAEYRDYLYIGTGNGAFGAASAGEIWRLAPVPEPSTNALVLVGLGVLAWFARRKPHQRPRRAQPAQSPAPQR